MASKKILSVDDDPMVRTIVRTMLESADYEVISASCGEEAFQLLKNQVIPSELSCIILDVQMPGMTGWDVLTRLKLHSDTQNIPVIMLTCQSDPDDLLTGYQSGAEYYITKPFTREQLLYGVEMALA